MKITNRRIPHSVFKNKRRDEGFYIAYEDASTISRLSYEQLIAEYFANSTYTYPIKYKENEDAQEYKDGFNTINIEYVRIL